MSTKSEKIKYAIYHNPRMIKSLMNDTSINKGMIYDLLHKAVPCRIGVEFELSGNFNKGFFDKYYCWDKDNTHTSLINKSEKEREIIRKYYGLKDFKSDHQYSTLVPEGHLEEVRVSIDNPNQLSGLFTFMSDLSEFCKIHCNGGIHIHLDMSRYIENKKYVSPSKMDNKDVKVNEMKSYITSRLDEISKIFPKYTGTYNKKSVGIIQKATWVNISRLNTFEFRIAPLTFDYVILMNWIEQLLRFRSKLITEMRLKPYKSVKSKSSKLYNRTAPVDSFPDEILAVDNALDTEDIPRVHVNNESVYPDEVIHNYYEYNSNALTIVDPNGNRYIIPSPRSDGTSTNVLA